MKGPFVLRNVPSPSGKVGKGETYQLIRLTRVDDQLDAFEDIGHTSGREGADVLFQLCFVYGEYL
jgi:hypothetical protein